MFDEALGLKDTLDVLNKIKSLNLEQASLDELIALLRSLGKHLAIGTEIPAGRVICRTVSCKYLADDPVSIYPLRVSQISYNPNLESCSYNRASWAGETVFYGSVATKDMESYHTNSFEVLSDLQNSNKEIDRETFVTGKWIVTKNLPLVHISGILKHNSSETAARYETFWKSIERESEKMVGLKAIDSFLCAEFIKEVPNDQKWLYKISAAYAHLLKEEKCVGILYPSVKADGAGYNVGLFPDTLNGYIKFERAALMTYYKREESFADEITMEALPDGDFLRWKEIYHHKMPPSMKRWYIGLSDDKSFDNFINYVDL